MRRALHAVTCLCFLTPAALAAQQLRHSWIELGGGAGLAGYSGQTYTFPSGKSAGLTADGGVFQPLSSRLAIGVEGDYWRRRVVDALFASAVARGYPTPAPFYIMAGLGWGSGAFGGARTSRPALKFGAGYDLPVANSVGFSLFARWMNTVGGGTSNTNVDVNNVELALAGLAISWR